MTPNEDRKFVEQVLLLGQAPVAWTLTSDVLRRGAEVLRQVSTEGTNRLTELTFKRPPPPEGEIETRTLTGEENEALLHGELWRVSLMLLAMAVECLIKGYLVKGGAVPVDQGGVLEKRFKTHGLRDLATDAGLDLSKDEREILDALTRFLVWRGRYPIPAKPEEFQDLSYKNIGGSMGQFVKEGFSLYDRISAHCN